MSDKNLIGIVEDNDLVREAISSLMTSHGHDVQSYETAEEFFDRDAFDSYSCLILDFSLPGMNGLDLVHKLNRAGSSIPIVVLSGTVDENRTNQLLQAGVKTVLKKPMIAPILVETVSRQLGD